MSAPQRILVIGSSGSGKSTFARRLGHVSGLPVTHIDRLFWEPGWVPASREVYNARLGAVLATDRWIVDGLNTSTLDQRIPRADLIVWLDRSRWACLWRIARRVAGNYGRVRPDMAEGCPEKIDLEFLRYVWNFPGLYRPRVAAALERHRAHSRLVILRSDRETGAYLSRWGKSELTARTR